MLKTTWLFGFFAFVFTLVLVLLFPNFRTIDLVQSQYNFGELNSNYVNTQFYSPYIPTKIKGDWIFVSDRHVTPTEFAESYFHSNENSEQSSSANPTFDYQFSYQHFVPDSNVYIDVLRYQTPAPGTYFTALSGLSNIFKTSELALSISPGCGVTKAYFYNPADFATAKAIDVYRSVGILGQLHADTSYLLLHVEKPQVPGKCHSPLVGSLRQLMRFESTQMLEDCVLIAGFITIAFYALGMYVYFHKDAANFWLGTWSLVTVLIFLNRSGFWTLSLGQLLDFAPHWFSRFQFIAVLYIGPLALQFYRHSLELRVVPRRLLRINLAVASIFALVVLVAPIHWLGQYVLWFSPFIILQILAVLSLFVLSVVNFKTREQGIILLSGFVLLIAIYLDLFPQVMNSEGIYLSQYALLLTLLSYCSIQSRRISRDYDLTSEATEVLAVEVKKKSETLELKNRMLMKVQSQLEKRNQELKTLTITDPLTGTYNRLYFDRQFQTEWKRAQREQDSFSLLLIDLDHFKKVNDQYGHLAGDECLREFAKWIQSTFKRPHDIVCRYGGEEFAVILPKTAPAQALKFAEQLRKLVEKNTVRFADINISMAVSIGICGTIPNRKTLASDLFKAADKALYFVKHNGRNGIKLENLAEQPSLANDFTHK